MFVSDIMTAPVHTIPATASADDARTAMRAKGIRHLVVMRGRTITGVVSDRDLGGRRGAAARAAGSVAEFMTAPPVTVEPSTTLRRAANLMRGRSIGCLVVTKGTAVAGIVTTADLLELIGRGVTKPVVVATRWTLKHRAPHRKRSASTGVW